MEELVRRQVAASEAGTRLDVLVAGWLGESRSRSQRRIDRQQVTLDGEAAAKSTGVQPGQTVVVITPPSSKPLRPPHVQIRYRDDHLAVVAKPAGLVVHDGAGVRGVTLVDALTAQGLPLAAAEDPRRPGIVHRLDRGTSGLLVVALSPAALDGLGRLFRSRGVRSQHNVSREYWALVEGRPDPPAATIDAPIVRSTSNRTVFTTGRGGREARTHYTTRAVHPFTAELAVTLDTGRTHQVRVHLRAIGRPIAGDVAYGASTELARRLGLQRPALHARRLAFAHPVTGEWIDVAEDLPADLAEARRRAGG